MKNEKTFFDKLNQNYSKLSKKQELTANYIKENYKTSALMSIIPLSKEIGVSEATVIRFANVLGYNGFTEMMNDIKEYIKRELTTVERFEKYQIENKSVSPIYNVISNNIDILNRLSIDISREAIVEIANKIKKSNRVIVIGFESTAPFAEYFGYNMTRCGKEVMILTEKTGALFDVLNFVNKQDFCISISFSRHSAKQIAVMDFLKEKGVEIYSITESSESPAAKHSKYNTFIPMNSSMMSISSVHVGILTILQMIMSEYILLDNDEISNNLNRLEEYNEFFKTFFQD